MQMLEVSSADNKCLQYDSSIALGSLKGVASAKIKNIEATEEAKMKLIHDKRNKKDGPSQFVPTNMAVNFVQHNRFNIEITGPDGKKNYKQQPAVKQDHSDEKNIDKRKKKDNATDDFHYERFKKQFRRY